MTVDELIRKLAHYPGEAKIVMFTEAGKEHYYELNGAVLEKPYGSFKEPVVVMREENYQQAD